jgi:hypothetical protein
MDWLEGAAARASLRHAPRTLLAASCKHAAPGGTVEASCARGPAQERGAQEDEDEELTRARSAEARAAHFVGGVVRQAAPGGPRRSGAGRRMRTRSSRARSRPPWARRCLRAGLRRRRRRRRRRWRRRRHRRPPRRPALRRAAPRRRSRRVREPWRCPAHARRLKRRQAGAFDVPAPFQV